MKRACSSSSGPAVLRQPACVPFGEYLPVSQAELTDTHSCMRKPHMGRSVVPMPQSTTHATAPAPDIFPAAHCDVVVAEISRSLRVLVVGDATGAQKNPAGHSSHVASPFELVVSSVPFGHLLHAPPGTRCVVLQVSHIAFEVSLHAVATYVCSYIRCCQSHLLQAWIT